MAMLAWVAMRGSGYGKVSLFVHSCSPQDELGELWWSSVFSSSAIIRSTSVSQSCWHGCRLLKMISSCVFATREMKIIRLWPKFPVNPSRPTLSVVQVLVRILFTWLTLTAGRVSLAGFRLEVILVTTAGCGGMVPRPGGLAWDPPPPPDPWREMGLWGPLLELEDDLRLIKAISTVGSGLQHTGQEAVFKMRWMQHF